MADLQKPDLNKPGFKLMPDAVEAIQQNKCPTCGKPIGKFRDALSEKEYSISGICQECQDRIFGK